MKRTFFDKIPTAAILILLSGLFWQGCSKVSGSSTVNSTTSTITDFLKAGTNTTLFYKAVTRTGLDSILAQAGPYTFFVVPDNVLIAYGINDSVISNYPDSLLRNLILYHTLAGQAILSSNFSPNPNSPVVMANGDSVFTSLIGSNFFVNGWQVTSRDVLASNGFIDVLSHVLMPATGTILQTLQSDSSYSLLLAAIIHASQGSTNVDSILSGPGPFTVFAPVNSAFNAAGYQSANDINNANPDTLANLLLYHVLARRYFTSDMIIGDTPVTLIDSSFTVTGPSNNTWQIQGKLNTAPSNILSQNVMAQNGVLQVIDQLLLP
ncbi:MAG TPA: fasciclin domain-containing protein [Puia sp.]|nr:fasciclin domain-containing protein [Puia sp.]